VTEQPFSNLIAVDIGNSRLKLGRFDRAALPSDPAPLPEPISILEIPITAKSGEFESQRLDDWLEVQPNTGTLWLLSSVHRGATGRLTSAIDRWSDRVGETHVAYLLTSQDVPLVIRVEAPEGVGMDRLVGCVAANRLRQADHPAIVIDMGTAVTVDRLDPDGAFAGGAILPGIALAARALHDHTDALPDLSAATLSELPPALGKSTNAAMESGLFWGTVGGVRELVRQLVEGEAELDVFVTGGGSAVLAIVLSEQTNLNVCHVPHLVLSGIALVDQATRPRQNAEATSTTDHA
jgi:type III pantothenate kinase